MKHYIVYDSRANYDEDEAQILEVFEETTEEKAIHYFNKCWHDFGAVLFSYDVNGNELENGQLIASNVQ